MNFYELYQLINEYGENLITNLIEKFKKEEPGLTPTIIKNYIDRFERIKNNLPEKDINKYSWKDLENAVDGYQTKDKIKAGKLDPTVTDANLLYNQNGIRIYLGKDKKSCIRYGNGYTFCISARGKESMYGYYRVSNRGTPYFIFNDNLPKENINHVLVLFVYNKAKKRWNSRYSITNALNKGEKFYEKLQDIINQHPWLKPITNFVDDIDKGDLKAEPLEEIEYMLESEWSESEVISLDMGDEFNRLSKQGFLSKWKFSELFENMSPQEIKDFLNNDLKVANVGLFYNNDSVFSGKRAYDQFFATYRNNTDDILKKIKEKTSEHLQYFKYKESENLEYQTKIAKALNFKFKTVDAYLNNYSGEGWMLKYDDGEGANVKFRDIENNLYFLAKTVDISHIILTDINKDKIEDLLKIKIKRNKILNWLKAQSEETLDKILYYRDKPHKVPPLFYETLIKTANFTDFVGKFMEMNS